MPLFTTNNLQSQSLCPHCTLITKTSLASFSLPLVNKALNHHPSLPSFLTSSKSCPLCHRLHSWLDPTALNDALRHIEEDEGCRAELTVTTTGSTLRGNRDVLGVGGGLMEWEFRIEVFKAIPRKAKGGRGVDFGPSLKMGGCESQVGFLVGVGGKKGK